MSGTTNDELPRGTPLVTVHGRRRGHVESLLGAGGQGAVYAVAIEGTRFALKWYHDDIASIDRTLRARLSRAIGIGPPTDRFLWPIDLVEIAGSNSFGYVMPLRDGGYNGMRDLIARPPKRVDLPLGRRVMVCLRIAQNFLELHARGFCYQDINFGNIFFHTQTGDILICDNDNVDVDGMDAAVFGTRKFMAPEVVRRETLPSTKTDLFSMAVLFFYIIHSWHPLDGRRENEVQIMDSSAETSLYGRNPVFIFDPNDQSNGPVPGVHDAIVARWNSLTPAIRSLFTRSFTVGLRQPGERVLEPEWRTNFARMVDGCVTCQHCRYDQAPRQGVKGQTLMPTVCVACGRPMALPPVLLIGRDTITLGPGVGIAIHHIDPDRVVDFNTMAGIVEEHPTNKAVWGLRNLMRNAWKVTLADGSSVTVDPGRAVRIMDETTVDFGRRTGRFVTGETGTVMRERTQ
jgi:hypothetical protein